MAARRAIGVDLGGQSVKLAVVEPDGVVRLRRQAPLEAAWPEPQIRQRVLDEIGAIREASARQGRPPACVGLAMPGYLDRDRTRVLLAANLPTLDGTDFCGSIREALDLPIVFDADCNAAALAEHRFGAGRGVDRLIVATVGTGIGAGVVIGGEILRVWGHLAGSLGHVVVDARGPRCACGAIGCVEALAAGPALERRAGAAAKEQPDSRLAALGARAGRLTGVEIGEAARAGDAAAAAVIEETGWWLGAGVASWCVIYRPEKVLLGGGVAALGELLLWAVRKGLAEVGQPTATGQVIVDLAALGPEAGAVGAAALALRESGDND